jgi:tRNA A-37 threonylcarbamoyl transferase component Bud32
LDSVNPNLVLRYKADASKHGMLAMIATSPIWAIWMPWMILWLTGQMFANGIMNSGELVLMIAFFMAVIALAVTTVFVCRDNTLEIGESGIKVPVRFILHTLGRRRLSWNQLKSVAFQTDRKISVDPEDMCFFFKGLSCVPLRMDGFDRDDIPKIMLAVQAYAPTTPFLPELDQIKGLVKQNASIPMSFTKLWEEELNNRFGSTIFVPMEAGHELQSGRVKIVGQIAFGGLSAIYLAKLDNEKLVVIKEAVVPQNADEASKEKALEMFSREAQFLVKLKHARIAEVYDHFVENGRNYLILQYIEGKDLRSYVKENGPMPEEVVSRWAGEIADILQYLHSLEPPIIHRDLVLARDGSISLIDFGAANNFMGTATGTLVGKQSYISPEQFRGKARPISDLYSLGCTLHYLLTGKDPEPLAVSHPRELNAAVTEDMDAFVALLTQQEDEDRMQAAAEAAATAKKIAESHQRKMQHETEMAHNV